MKEGDKASSERNEILKMSDVSLRIATYDDIFSDFDPRNYSQRALSHDFLAELKRATRDTSTGQLILHFMMPKDKRSFNDETLVKRRLREHFKKHYLMILDDVRKTKAKGIFMAILGVVFIAMAAFIESLKFDYFLFHFLVVLLEPAGWFTAWTGLDQIYYGIAQKREDLNFYEKMSNAEIVFLGY